MLTIDSALDTVLAAVQPLECEDIAILDAAGRALGETVIAARDMPSFAHSAMDGYAIAGEDLRRGSVEFEIVGDMAFGTAIALELGSGQAAKIMTGCQLPSGADTVVPVELTSSGRYLSVGERVHFSGKVSRGANVRLAGEDFSEGSPVLLGGQHLGPAELGVLASIGRARALTARRPRVAIVGTGSELVEPGEPLGPGQIYDANSYAIYGQVRDAGGEPLMLGIAPDGDGATQALLRKALRADVLVTTGGVSMGESDSIGALQDQLGVERRFWGVRIKPGWPVTFGRLGRTLVFGLPGNPVAAMVAAELFVRPALLALQGRSDLYRPFVIAAAAEPVKPTKARVEALRCRLIRKGNRFTFARTGPQGSGMLRSMSLADGLALIPPNCRGGEPGEEFVVMQLVGTSSERPPFGQ